MQKNKLFGFTSFMAFMLIADIASAQALPEFTTEVTGYTNEIDIDVNGFGSTPKKKLPFSVEQVSSEQIEKGQISRLSDITKIDSSVSDSYNASGYWDLIAIRGFTLNNRTNFFREDLPINAETPIPLQNKSSIQILKGVAAIQSGLGAPGGVVNYKVKRPSQGLRSELQVQANETGGLLTAIDFNLNQLRVNAALEKLSPHLQHAKGERLMAAVAYDIDLTSHSKIQTELEWSYQKQPTQGGFSLLGSAIPDVTKFRSQNLNNQSWTQPTLFQATTGSVKYINEFNDSTKFWISAGAQLLKSDDRLAYAYGCTAESNFDRFCSNGNYDVYDYRSDNEFRNTYALKFDLQKSMANHQIGIGFLLHTLTERYQMQAFNYVGVANVDGLTQLPSNAALTGKNTNRDLHESDFYLTDVIRIEKFSLWLALHSVNVKKRSFRTDDSQKVDYKQSFLNPALALAYQLTEPTMIYASYSQGAESYVTPNKPGYAHPGQFVPDVLSRQYEVGLKTSGMLGLDIAFFQIQRPEVADLNPNYQIDGYSEHLGYEASAHYSGRSFGVNLSYLGMKATRKASELTPAMNGMRPTNVPSEIARVLVDYSLGGAYNIKFNLGAGYEAKRMILPDNALELPAWTTLDAGLAADFTMYAQLLKLRLNVTNILDAQYWKESPTYYQHIYLYASAERSFVLAAAITF